MSAHWSRRLPVGAWCDAKKWARRKPSAAAAWRDCKRGDWMLWIIGRLSGKPGSRRRKRLVLCLCDCADLTRPYWCDGTPAETLRVARAWARGKKVTLAQVRAAAGAAWVAAGAAAWAATRAGAAAAEAAATAAEVAVDAAEAAAAAWAAGVAESAEVAAWAAGADETTVLAQCADIVRRHYPNPPRLKTRDEP